MAERVVDLLEAIEIEIEHQHRAGALALGRRAEDLFERVAHLRSVGEAGERIKQREARDLLFAAALFGEIGAVAAEAAEVLVGIIDRSSGERPPTLLALRCDAARRSRSWNAERAERWKASLRSVSSELGPVSMISRKGDPRSVSFSRPRTRAVLGEI
jgi:hypothetical protein